jgi:serine phosphatase RsbU (regulator of sigma subunit)/Tfp pilus assembly protein PilF
MSDTDRVKTTIFLANQYLNRGDYDRADSSINISEKLAAKAGYKVGIVSGLITKGVIQQFRNDYDKALDIYKKALALAMEVNYREGMAIGYTNIGILYRAQGEPDKALDYYFKALRLNEVLGNKKNLASSYGNIANIHFGESDYEKSLEMSLKAAAIREEIKDKRGLIISYNTIGLIYQYTNRLDESLQWFFKGMKIAEELNSKSGMADMYGVIAMNYAEQKKFELAQVYAEKALKLRLDLGNTLATADIYDILGHIYFKQGKVSRAKEIFLKSVKLAEEMESKPDMMDSYQSISLCDSAAGDYKSAFLFFRKHARLKGEMFNEEKEEKIAEMQTKFESEKKEQQIKLLNAEKESQARITLADTKRRNTIIISITAGFILVLIVAVIILRSLRITRRQKAIIEQSHMQIEEQKELIEEKQKEILDSIKYASRIQKALLTSENFIKRRIEDSFILYKPKDIVAGDFYWASEVQPDSSSSRLFYLVVADCTGHGVPGAFMSLLNISILNEIINERKIYSPEKILNEARTSIIKALNPEGSEESQDGMDCILVEINFEQMRMRYAAANNAFYIVRNGELIYCKADKMPVGKSPNQDKSFTLFEVQLEKNDCVYLITDGFADQFGGEKGKKYKYKTLEQKFLEIAALSMSVQREELTKSFDQWKGNLEQVDDVCVIGIKF